MTDKSQWQLSEIRNDNEPMLIRKKLVVKKEATSGNDYVIYLTFGCAPPEDMKSFYTKADADTLLRIDENDIPALEDKTGAQLVGAVSAPRVRDFIFYSDDPEGFLESAEYLRESYPQFQIGCECSPDPEWEQYRDLPPTGPQ